MKKEENNNFGEKIKEIRDFFCKNNREFAEIMGEKENTTSNWISRGAKFEVAKKVLEKFPKVNKIWMLADEGNMLIGDTTVGDNNNIQKGDNNNINSHNNTSTTIEKQYINKKDFDFEKFTMIANDFPALGVTDKDGRIKVVSRDFEKQTGYSIYDCIGKTFAEVLQRDDFPKAETSRLRVLLKSGEYFHAEMKPYYHKNGTKLLCDIHIFPFDEGFVSAANFLEIE